MHCRAGVLYFGCVRENSQVKRELKREPREARVGARVTRTVRDIIDALMVRYNYSEADVIEMVFRDFAATRDIRPLARREEGQE